MKKLLSLLFALLLLVGCSAGRNQNPELILTVAGESVMKPEFEYYLEYIAQFYRDSYGLDSIQDWSAQEDGLPLEEYFLNYAVGVAKSHRAVRAQAEKQGLGLTEAQQAEISDTFAQGEAAYGKSEYEAMVIQSYKSMELYNYLLEVGYLSDNLFQNTYGQLGEDLTDSQLLEYCQDKEYMCLKLIVMEDNEENRRTMEGLAAELADCTQEEFDRAMDEHGQLEAMNSRELPDGAVFDRGYFGDAVQAAYEALEPGQVSGLLEGPGELYIIIRLNIEPNMTNINGYALRYSVAWSMFQEQLESWADQLECRLEPGYYLLDVKQY